jgi:hypothetical protein
MPQFIVAGLCGFVGGVIAVILLGKANGHFSIGFSRSPGPEFYKDVEILEHAPRPQGVYVRFRNHGSKPIEMANFKVRGYKGDKLWAEFEEGAYSETQPGQEQEAILKLVDYRNPTKIFDLSDCRVDVKFLYGYVLTRKSA